MSDSLKNPWSNNPNAPNISSLLYTGEKENFIGTLIGAMLHGIVIILFFKCMGASFNRTRGDIRWRLVALTVALVSFATINLADSLVVLSNSYSLYNRDFPSINHLQSGPMGYKAHIYREAISVIPSIMFPLNQWLADGLLLYRCYNFYAMNYRVLALPCLVYITSVATGIAWFYETLQPELLEHWTFVGARVATAYFSVSLSLNILLTLIIIARLLPHNGVRSTMGASHGVGAFYRSIVTILVESCALYAISLLLYLGPHIAKDSISNAFYPILVEVEVIAPLLIILRVTKQTALTSDSIVSGNVDPIRFMSQEDSASGNWTSPDGGRVSSKDSQREIPSEGIAGVAMTIEEVPL